MIFKVARLIILLPSSNGEERGRMGDLGLICVAESLGSFAARSLSVLQLGSLSLRPFALFNCLREKA